MSKVVRVSELLSWMRENQGAWRGRKNRNKFHTWLDGVQVENILWESKTKYEFENFMLCVHLIGHCGKGTAAETVDAPKRFSISEQSGMTNGASKDTGKRCFEIEFQLSSGIQVRGEDRPFRSGYRGVLLWRLTMAY